MTVNNNLVVHVLLKSLSMETQEWSHDHVASRFFGSLLENSRVSENQGPPNDFKFDTTDLGFTNFDKSLYGTKILSAIYTFFTMPSKYRLGC